MDNTWKNDPRLKQMNPDKLAFLEELASRTEHTRQNALLPQFLMMTKEAQQKGLQFNNEETDLLVSILTMHMSPTDRNKLNTLKMLSKRITKK